MNINTKYFGEIIVAEEEKITFPSGIFGFSDYKSYFLLPFSENENSDEPDDDMLCLQSAEDPSLAFVIVNPFAIVPDYRPLLLTGDDLAEIGSTPEDELAFYAIAVIHENLHDSTTNLKCPVVINPKNRKGKQVIFDSDTYSMRHLMWPLAKAEEDGSC